MLLKKRIVSGITIMGMLLLLLGISDVKTQAATQKPDEQNVFEVNNPSYLFNSVSDQSVSTDSTGKVTIIIFYKDGCYNCEQTFYELKQCSWFDALGIDIVAVDINDGTKEEVETYQKKYNFTQEQIAFCYGKEGNRILWNYVAAIYGADQYRITTPISLIIDSNNVIRYASTGLISSSYFDTCIYELLPELKKENTAEATATITPTPVVTLVPKVTNLPALVSMEQMSLTSVRLIWKKTLGYSGYEIYRSTKKTSGYKLIKSISNVETVTYINKNLTKGKTYYYKVRAYVMNEGEKVYSKYSAVMSIKLAKKMLVVTPTPTIKSTQAVTPAPTAKSI